MPMPPFISAASPIPASANESVILTPGDVERLLKDDSPSSRVGVLEKVADRYNMRGFVGREREIAEQIFRLLMKDTALAVRETLAAYIKDNPEIPRDIVLHMAADVDKVAVPVLESSNVFSDADLVRIVEASSDIAKLLAISRRPQVSERVSDALVGTQYPQVVTSLVTNEGAAIGERTFERIVQEFKGELSVMSAIIESRELPVTLVERLVSHASAAMAGQLKEKYGLTDEQIGAAAGSTREDIMLRLLAQDVSEEEVVRLVTQMDEERRLTPSLVMTALCRGQLPFFTAALARYAFIPMENAKRLVSDKGEHGFRGLYEKTEMPDSMFQAMVLLLRTVQSLQEDEAIPGSLLYANRLAERVLAAAGERQVEYLPYFIALIRQNVQRH
jgi:uncharacterized protein (DUF2336 family)